MPQTDSSYLKTEEIMEDILQEPTGEFDNSELYEGIEQMMLNPLNLNQATADDLTTIPGMDLNSASLIVNHRNKYGNFFSLNELNTIENLDKNIIRNIAPFVYLEEKKDIISENESKSGSGNVVQNSDFILRSRIINSLQENKGFNEQKYEGTKPKIYNRLILRYNKQYQIGYLAEKDAGEKSLNEFSTYHLAINKLGIIHRAVVMDYLLEFGQGLTLWSPYAFSKGSDAVYPVKRTGQMIKPYTSTTENNFFRGGAATVKIENLFLSAFYSNNSFDANIDSVSGSILSTPEDGLHRTASELNNRKSAVEKMFGGRLDFVAENLFSAGLLHYRSKYSNIFEPSTVFDITGSDFNFSAFYYNLFTPYINFSGEFSYNGISVASINILTFMLNNNFTFTASVRNYPRNFFSLHGYAFGERSGATNNEFGIYAGLKWRTLFGLINFYYDQFKFPYATFFNPQPAAGDEFLLDYLSRSFNKLQTRLRYKYENKDVPEAIGNTRQMVKRVRQMIRLELIYNISNKVRLKGRFEYNSYNINATKLSEKGYLIFQDIRFSPTENFNLYGRIIFFKTDSFNSAIYEYENNLTGVLTNIALYGQGIRWYLLARYKLFDNIAISLRYSETYKPREDSIGSGDNEIPVNLDNVLGFQLDVNI